MRRPGAAIGYEHQPHHGRAKRYLGREFSCEFGDCFWQGVATSEELLLAGSAKRLCQVRSYRWQGMSPSSPELAHLSLTSLRFPSQRRPNACCPVLLLCRVRSAMLHRHNGVSSQGRLCKSGSKALQYFGLRAASIWNLSMKSKSRLSSKREPANSAHAGQDSSHDFAKASKTAYPSA